MFLMVSLDSHIESHLWQAFKESKYIKGINDGGDYARIKKAFY
jgi:hypothetical protein